ncbi:YadA-like family protein [Phascolarctobacterium succinatutens]|uniref:YadA-like family protein n=1 Tax=Phascolarctobacterium succinatutens TaxID=626940 RepID=UPI003AAC31B3
MKKTLAKAIMLSVLTMAVTSGIAYAEQDTVLGHSHKNEKMEFTNGNITENGITLNDPNIMHNAPGTTVHGHTDECGEQVDDTSLTIGDLNKVTDKLVENDKNLNKRINDIQNTIDSGGLQDTVTTAESKHDILRVEDVRREMGDKHYEIDINVDALKDFVQNNATNTITTVADDNNGYVTVDGGEDGNYNYTVSFNEEKLIQTINDNDKNTITTVHHDNNGYVTVTEAPDPNQSGNHAYTVSFNEQKLNAAIEAQDRYVNGGSIGEDGSITLNVHNGRDVILEGQMKDARLTDIERDKEAGTATLVVKDRYNPEEVNRLTIDDIASKAQNDRDHAEFREHFSELDYRVDNLGSRVDKVGAGAAALAALHPMDFDPDDKLTFAAGYGNYKGKNAAAVGAFYRPDEKVMLSVGGTFGNGENMVNAGISFSLDRTARVSNSRTAMAKEIVDLRANVANLTALVGQLTAGMGGTIEMDRMKLFPDVPENHWAYEYIGRLAAAGIVEGYPDGMFNGNRMMSRYEFAAMLYRALEKGVKLDHKLVREFEPEMGRIHVARISGADGDRGKIERVRVYGGDNRDHYGSKLK